ncbi:hypothetical protein BaRGS_00037884 [Batillaria attramentaria]|uniref:LRRK2 ARM repeat domain-containing protein n=1 Tax=Batillaria attramentaria TaxID=370345 RepID=A0ABD0J7G6_9CAEN
MTSFQAPSTDNTATLQADDTDCSKRDGNDGVISRGLRAEGACGQSAGHVTFNPRDISHANLGLSLFRSNFPSLQETQEAETDARIPNTSSDTQKSVRAGFKEPELCKGLDEEALLSALGTCLASKTNTLSFAHHSELETKEPQQRGLKHVLDTVFESPEVSNSKLDQCEALDGEIAGRGNSDKDLFANQPGIPEGGINVNSKDASDTKPSVRRPTPCFFPSAESNQRLLTNRPDNYHPQNTAPANPGFSLPSFVLSSSSANKSDHADQYLTKLSFFSQTDDASYGGRVTSDRQSEETASVSAPSLVPLATGSVQDGLQENFRSAAPVNVLPPIAERAESDVTAPTALAASPSAFDSGSFSAVGLRKTEAACETEAEKREIKSATNDLAAHLSADNIRDDGVVKPENQETQEEPAPENIVSDSAAMSRAAKVTSVGTKQPQRRSSGSNVLNTSATRIGGATSVSKNTKTRSEKARNDELLDATLTNKDESASPKLRKKGVSSKHNMNDSDICQAERASSVVTGGVHTQSRTMSPTAAYDVSMDEENIRVDISNSRYSRNDIPEPTDSVVTGSRRAQVSPARSASLQFPELSNVEYGTEHGFPGASSSAAARKEDRSQSDPKPPVSDLSLPAAATDPERSPLKKRLFHKSASDVGTSMNLDLKRRSLLLSSQSDFTLSPSRRASLAVTLEDNSDRIRRNSVSILRPIQDRAQKGDASPSTERAVPVPKRKSSSKEHLLKVLDTGPQSPSSSSSIAAALEFFTWTHLSTTIPPEDLHATTVTRGELQITLPVCHVTKNGNTASLTTVEAIQQTLMHLHPNLQVLLASMTSPDDATAAGGAPEEGSAAAVPVPVSEVSSLPVTAASESSVAEPVSPSALEDASDEMAALQNTYKYTFGKRRRSSTRTAGVQEESRRSSINTCIRDMREQSSNYSKQLIGVQIVGHYADEETLKVVLAKSDAISCVITAMKAFPEKEELQCQACVSLLKMASASEANCVHICKNDGVAAIASTMRRYDDNLEVIRMTLSILGYMSTADCVTEELLRQCCHRDVLVAMSLDTAKQLMLIGGVHTIISMMKRYHDDKDILENGCRALGSFAVYDETCLDVAQAGATATVVETMKSNTGDESVNESGCWALACLTCTAATCEEFVTLGGLDVLLHTLEAFPKEELLQDYGVRTLCNLGGHETTLQDVSTVQVVKVFLSLCQNFPDSVETLEIVMICLAQLAATETEVHRCMLYDGGVRSVVSVMRSFLENRTIQGHGCRILGNMAVHENLRKAAEQQGASQAVISAMLNMEMFADIQLYGCMALMNLTADLMDNKMRVKNNGAVPTLLSTIRQFPGNPEVVLSALKTLGNLVDLEECCRQLLDDKGLAIIINIARDPKADDSIRSFAALVLAGLTALTDLPRGELVRIEETLVALQAALPHDPDLALSMCQGLHNLLKTESKKGQKQNVCLLTECTVGTVLSSIRAFPEEKELQMVGFGALSCICENFAKLRGVIVREGGVSDVTKAMTRFPTDDRLHAVGHIALAYLLPIDSKENPKDAAMVLEVIGTSMSQFVENEELQISGCRVLERCDITGMDDVLEALTHVRNAMRRHGDSDKILQAAAKVFKRLGGDDCDALVEKFVNTPTPISKVFWTTLRE